MQAKRFVFVLIRSKAVVLLLIDCLLLLPMFVGWVVLCLVLALVNST